MTASVAATHYQQAVTPGPGCIAVLKGVVVDELWNMLMMCQVSGVHRQGFVGDKTSAVLLRRCLCNKDSIG